MGKHCPEPELIKCLYSNLQSFVNKRDEIVLRISENDYDLLFFTEIWIGDQHHESELHLPGFQKLIVDPQVHGGACIFVRSGIDFTVVKPPYAMNESVRLCVNTKDNVRRLYSCVYRSPNSVAENNFLRQILKISIQI